jgi:CubicO group peptidase (beta-lactamase class C family)
MVERCSVAAQGRSETRASILHAAQAEPLQNPPGSSYRYSDLGFLMLASVLESLGGQRLDALFEQRVLGPSRADLRWGWPGAAATEDCPHRGRVVVGEVHDLNAWLMGGVSSHAGLFGTAAEVAANAAWQLRAWGGRSDEGLDPEVVRRFFSTKGAGSHRLGWDGVSPGGSAGERWPRDGVGHLAFTGCSIWMAPQQGFVAVLVSNRLHPEVEGGSVPDAPIHPRYAAFRALRPAVYSAIADALGLASGVSKG